MSGVVEVDVGRAVADPERVEEVPDVILDQVEAHRENGEAQQDVDGVEQDGHRVDIVGIAAGPSMIMIMIMIVIMIVTISMIMFMIMIIILVFQAAKSAARLW